MIMSSDLDDHDLVVHHYQQSAAKYQYISRKAERVRNRNESRDGASRARAVQKTSFFARFVDHTMMLAP
jgi:hypothetical protein